MKIYENIECNYCDSSFTVEVFDSEEIPSYCPVCGSSVEYGEDDENYEEW